MHDGTSKSLYEINIGDRIKTFDTQKQTKTFGYVKEILCSPVPEQISRWQNTTFRNIHTNKIVSIVHTAQHQFLLRDKVKKTYAWGNLDTTKEQEERLEKRGTPNAFRPLTHNLGNTMLQVVGVNNSMFEMINTTTLDSSIYPCNLVIDGRNQSTNLFNVRSNLTDNTNDEGLLVMGYSVNPTNGNAYAWL